MNIIDIRVPEEQQEGTSSTFAAWLVQPGAAVEANQPIAELETDKVTVEIAAPAAGVLAEQLCEPGDPVHPGEVIARLRGGAAPDAAAAAGVAPVAAPPGQRKRQVARRKQGDARLSPAVRRLLAQYGLEAHDITGSGRDGRITAEDVTAHRKSQRAPSAAAHGLSSRKVPHDAMRRRIAEHMVASLLRIAPHVTSVFEADMSAVLAHRQAHKEDYAKRGVNLTLTAYLVAASAAAMRSVPEVNSRWHEDHLELIEEINIGVGTALGDRGLIVPVIRGVGERDLLAIAAALGEHTTRARDGTLDPEAVRGGTFTISNHGVGGSLLAAPIVINQPQTAILGAGKLQKRVVVVERDGADTMAIRPMMYLTLSIDHRALDAFQANRFLAAVVRTLETWR